MTDRPERVEGERCPNCGCERPNRGPSVDYNPETENPPPLCSHPFHDQPVPRFYAHHADGTVTAHWTEEAAVKAWADNLTDQPERVEAEDFHASIAPDDASKIDYLEKQVAHLVDEHAENLARIEALTIEAAQWKGSFDGMVSVERELKARIEALTAALGHARHEARLEHLKVQQLESALREIASDDLDHVCPYPRIARQALDR